MNIEPQADPKPSSRRKSEERCPKCQASTSDVPPNDVTGPDTKTCRQCGHTFEIK